MMLKPMAIALVHYPVLDRRGDIVTSAVTNLDIHDLARLATTYHVSRFYLVTPAEEQQVLASRIISHWQQGFGASYNPDRCQALDCLQIKNQLEDAVADWRELNAGTGIAVLTGARHQNGLGFSETRQLAVEQPLMLVFGTGHGLAPVLYTPERPCLESIKAGQYNHLSVRTAAAIILDRLIGEDSVVSDLHPCR
jgi:hypothetical protein